MTMEVDGKRPHITAGLGPGECLNGVKRGVGVGRQRAATSAQWDTREPRAAGLGGSRVDPRGCRARARNAFGCP